MINKCLFCNKTYTPVNRGKRGREQKYCSVSCGLRSHKSQNLGNKFSDDTKKMMRERMIGNKYGFQKGHIPTNYLQDRSLVKHQEDRNNPRYKEWRHKCARRDRFKCKINNKNCCGKISVHHILGFTEHPELRYEINNGITLCKFHHPIKREDEKKLIPIFTEIIRNDYIVPLSK